jgi:hypothetical protein
MGCHTAQEQIFRTRSWLAAKGFFDKVPPAKPLICFWSVGRQEMGGRRLDPFRPAGAAGTLVFGISPDVIARSESDEAIQTPFLDCFASLAMTALNPSPEVNLTSH